MELTPMQLLARIKYMKGGEEYDPIRKQAAAIVERGNNTLGNAEAAKRAAEIANDNFERALRASRKEKGDDEKEEDEDYFMKQARKQGLTRTRPQKNDVPRRHFTPGSKSEWGLPDREA